MTRAPAARSSLLAAAVVAAMTLVPGALRAPAVAAEPVAADWDTAADGGQLADEVARFSVASPVPWNNDETVLVTGGANKPAALQTLGVNDVDVVTSAFDVATGEPVWSSRFDGGPGVDDQPVAFEINGNNNLAYVTARSGADAVVVAHSIRDGAAEEIVRSPGVRANESAISPAGGFMGVVGTEAGRFFVRSFGTGSGDRDKGFVDTPVAGEAFSADIPSPDNAPIDVQRTLLVTGRESGFGDAGGFYTAAYDYRTFERRWERRWTTDGNRRDEGVVATAAWTPSTDPGAPRGIGFVAGRTLVPSGQWDHHWDIVVTAYDLLTGASLWTAGAGDPTVVTFDGEDGGDDVPVAVEYSHATGTVYVAGLSDRPPPHGDDVVVLAFDALTGERRGLAYAAGGAGNGDDVPVGLTVTPDGARVLVPAEVDDIGGRRAALFAFDADLHPAGHARLGDGAGGDPARAAGAHVALDGTGVVLAGSTDEGMLTGHDHRAAAFPLAGFEVEPIPTTLAFTSGSPIAGQHTDAVTLEVELSGPDGPLGGQAVTIGLAGRSETATTGSDGRAAATFALDGPPGDHEATAEFAGDAPLLPATATAPFTVEREDTSLTLTVTGRGSNRTLVADLADADGSTGGVPGREIVFSADGDEIGRATTGPDGVAVLEAPPGHRGAPHAFTAAFAGDAFFLPASST